MAVCPDVLVRFRVSQVTIDKPAPLVDAGSLRVARSFPKRAAHNTAKYFKDKGVDVKVSSPASPWAHRGNYVMLSTSSSSLPPAESRPGTANLVPAVHLQKELASLFPAPLHFGTEPALSPKSPALVSVPHTTTSTSTYHLADAAGVCRLGI